MVECALVIMFYWSTKSLLLGMKCKSKLQDLQIFCAQIEQICVI